MKKTILITGAGSGIGRSTALALAGKGRKVIATTETEEQSLAFQEELRSRKLDMSVFNLDITQETDRRKIEGIEMNVLINNAGIGESGSLAEIDIDRLRRNFEVNVFSSMAVSQVALKGMMNNGGGTILFVSSLLGRVTMPFLAPYSMTKFALSSGAEALRTEIHRVRNDIHVSLIEPGAYFTGFNQKNIAKKFAWMNEDSIFYPIMPRLKVEEEKQFRLLEAKDTATIVRKIVRAAEARKPRLRYSAPWWQAAGVQVLRIFGK